MSWRQDNESHYFVTQIANYKKENKSVKNVARVMMTEFMWPQTVYAQEHNENSS